VLGRTPLVQEAIGQSERREIIMGTNSSHLVQSNNDQLMSAGTKQYLANVPSLSVAGESMTPAQIAQLFDDRVASTQTVQTATAGRTAAVKPTETRGRKPRRK
jgi:hypothetical protein